MFTEEQKKKAKLIQKIQRKLDWNNVYFIDYSKKAQKEYEDGYKIVTRTFLILEKCEKFKYEVR